MPRAKKPPTLPFNAGLHAAATPDVPTGLPYGQNQAAQQAIQAAPLAGGATPGPVQPANLPPAAPPTPDQVHAAAAAYNPPGATLASPTENPSEPVTAGLPSGPGPGPEALNLPNPQQADMQTWSTYLPTLEYMASMPGSTATTRNFVRLLRAALPPVMTSGPGGVGLPAAPSQAPPQLPPQLLQAPQGVQGPPPQPAPAPAG